MAKRSPIVEISSYGIYSQWDSKSKHLPKIQEFTTKVPAEVDIEFGFVVNIKKAKGAVIEYCIDHPGITNKKGQLLEAFTGELHINSNDWDFYLGDTIWEPLDDKAGKWRMTLSLDSRVIAEKTFTVFLPDEAQFWKQRGF
ncbi:DUF3859 domain-containing protein [Vibrio sinensis]|uniref:DUF3859 domain-containing protein n=1 Tax=Vibrio sinensis TaxID=2302434 RepID=A0A3A6QQK4_9VIBR|nr:DUF3859 domain-containing protein [Vibrio sinensis]RJX72896.1 DUF3859 domain-containing protein [Vibrio sinensis]